MTDDTSADEPRILPLQPGEYGEEGWAAAKKLRANFGLSTEELPDSIATMLRHPKLYVAQVDFVTQRTKASVLDPRALELVILRTGWLCQSGYVWGEHVNFGKKAGLTSEEIERASQGSSAEGWNERERALMLISEELHETSFVSDETWELVAANFSEAEIIEIIAIIGSYHEVAFTYNTLRVRKIPGNPGLSAR